MRRYSRYTDSGIWWGKRKTTSLKSALVWSCFFLRYDIWKSAQCTRLWRHNNLQISLIKFDKQEIPNIYIIWIGSVRCVSKFCIKWLHRSHHLIERLILNRESDSDWKQTLSLLGFSFPFRPNKVFTVFKALPFSLISLSERFLSFSFCNLSLFGISVWSPDF